MRDPKSKYLLLMPGLIVIALITIVPVVQVLELSFRPWVITRSAFPGDYIGFDNYTRALGDPAFWSSVRVTTIYTAATVFMSLTVGLLIAVLLQTGTRLSTVAKTLLIFPFAISLTLRGYSFRFMLLDGSGIFDRMIDAVVPPLADVIWLNDPAWALFWLCIPVVWAWGPLSGLMLLGSLNNIDPEVFEAARLDGANPVQMFRRITLPLLRPMVLVLVLLIVLFSVRMFDLVATMTDGGPGRATETMQYFIYRQGFQIFDMGYASALSILLTLLMIAIAYVYARMLNL